MITQQPTLQTIDLDHNQFEITFGIDMQSGEQPLDVTIPNLGSMVADVYGVDFLKVNSPARGNFPNVRSIHFVLQTTQLAAGAVQAGTVYLVNPQTAQVLALIAPTPPALQFPSLVVGNVPFFCKSNQSIQVMRGPSVNCEARLSAVAFTFDCPAYLTTMI